MIKNWHHHYKNTEILDQLIEREKFNTQKALLIQVFTALTDEDKIASVCQHLTQRLPDAAIIGCTTYAYLSNSQLHKSGVFLCFTAFEHCNVNATVRPFKHNNFLTGQQLARDCCRPDTKVMILFANPLERNADGLLAGINSIAPDIMVCGGMAADNWTFDSTKVFNGESIISQGVAAACIDGTTLATLSHSSFGWFPIGKPMKITQVIDNRVYEIDNEPAQRIYARYIGAKLLKNSLLQLISDYPLMVGRNGTSVSRVSTKLHSDGSISFSGNFANNEIVQIAYGDASRISHDAIKGFKRLPVEEAEALFVYTCASRANFLKEGIQNELAPLAAIEHSCGFFSYGEFLGKDYLNHTITYLLLSEERTLNQAQLKPIIEQPAVNQETSQDALFHLIQETNNELTTLNQHLEQRVAEKTRQLTVQFYTHRATGLPNREQLFSDLDQSTEHRPTFLALFNIDAFRQLNDVYGFETGDKVLNTVAERCRRCLQSQPQNSEFKLYKLPSDEFAITGSQRLTTKAFQAAIPAIEEAICQQDMQIDGNRCNIRITFGIASELDTHIPSDNPLPLLAKADIALRQAREQRVDTVSYNRNLPIVKNLEHNIKWLDKLRQALNEGRVTAYFQPIFHADDGSLYRFEALVRIIADNGEIISPYQFLDVAKKSRLYHHLTRKVLEEAVALIKRCQRPVSINLSLEDLSHNQTLELIDKVISQPEIAPYLQFELLESEGFEDYSLVSRFIHSVKQKGCTIAIDDFGSGYSSFAHLAELAVDVIKIDGSLIKNIDTDQRLNSIAHSIVDFANRLNMATTAEFVHSDAVLSAVQSLGVTYTQGYLLSPPLNKESAEQFAHLAATQPRSSKKRTATKC